MIRLYSLGLIVASLDLQVRVIAHIRTALEAIVFLQCKASWPNIPVIVLRAVFLLVTKKEGGKGITF